MREPAQHLDGPRADGAAREQHGRERERRRHERGNCGGDRDAARKPLAEELEPPHVHEPLDAIVAEPQADEEGQRAAGERAGGGRCREQRGIVRVARHEPDEHRIDAEWKEEDG